MVFSCITTATEFSSYNPTKILILFVISIAPVEVKNYANMDNSKKWYFEEKYISNGSSNCTIDNPSNKQNVAH